MGAIYRATDTTLGREVAVKVLLEKYGPASGTACRFADEARIAAQLQHPGIPPVHDLGILPDGRPFLVMKLIKGETLDWLLKLRAQPAADCGRFIAVFEQVCHAVAYAHAHGVIHRDLKPANVMVGAFGDVQVMDWGLAKVLSNHDRDGTASADPDATAPGTVVQSLRDSDGSFTQAGSVLGTPAFMPPEQAAGAIGKVDARSDVFGLGAVLAVILTGQPPFTASSAETTRVKAAQGDVAECFARLDAFEAEPELVALCKRCLSPRPVDRPADAGVVARAVATLRAAADERARQAELDRVKAEGDKVAAELRAEGERQKADEQRKRRRVRLALAGLVLLVTASGGIAAVQVQRQRERDRIAGEQQLDEATRQKERETRAASLVDSLGGAETPVIPRIIEDLADLRDLARPKLIARLAGAMAGGKEHLHVSLALLPGDPAQVEHLRQRLLTAVPAEVVVIRQALTAHAAEVTPWFWAVAEDPDAEMDRRVRALAALAGLDPRGERWARLAGPLARRLVAESPLLVGEWLTLFRPVRLPLLPPLAAIYRAPPPANPGADLKQALVEFHRKSVAVSWLAEYAFDQPARLADYLMDADADQWAVLWPAFARFSEPGTLALVGELAATLPADVPSSDLRREALGKRQANAAVALLRLNRAAMVWPLLAHSADPRVRSYLIHRLSPLGADAKTVAKQLADEEDITIRRALLLSLGEFPETGLPADERKGLEDKLKGVYRTASDPGLHAASEWLLRMWKQEAWLNRENSDWAKDGVWRDKKLARIAESVKNDQEKTPHWYVNTQGQTMVVIPGPVEFRMGSPKTEADREEREVAHRRRIDRSFAIASKPVTLAEYRALTKDKYEIGEKYTYAPDLPVVGISWDMAANYCNRLSKAEGLEECYEIKGPMAVVLKGNYLSLSGYRLPTEAEMECATRARAGTSRYYGETDELLRNYAWYAKNCGDLLQRVGLKKPNDFGLFDTQGNCYVWCQDAAGDYPKANGEGRIEDKHVPQGQLVVDSAISRVLRGGAFDDQPSNVRSASRNINVPTTRSSHYGFRLVRTFIP